MTSATPRLPAEIAALKPAAAAKIARLRYVHDGMPGIIRQAVADGFVYRDLGGDIVGDEETLARIRALAIPPAWHAVWICPHPQGHVQATGRDDRGRKQYRYHPRWREIRDESKFAKLLVFGRALPLIRARVAADLGRRGLPRERVLAAVVRLMELTLIRIGNPEYAKENKHFGLTTLRRRHVAIEGACIHLDFRGKGGLRRESDINDRRLAGIIKRCRDLPGYELFQYLDEDGNRHIIDSGDVNDYLCAISGEAITAKDFRTWAATHLAALALQEFADLDGETARKKAIVRAVERVAAHLGNTPAICRRCYIHPAIVEGYLDGSLIAALQEPARADPAAGPHGMSADEAAVTAFLRLRLGAPEAAEGQPEKRPAPAARRVPAAVLNGQMN